MSPEFMEQERLLGARNGRRRHCAGTAAILLYRWPQRGDRGHSWGRLPRRRLLDGRHLRGKFGFSGRHEKLLWRAATTPWSSPLAGLRESGGRRGHARHWGRAWPRRRDDDGRALGHERLAGHLDGIQRGLIGRSEGTR